MLLAGIGFMGAIQDALSGFYVTGGARILEAILATAGIIAGVSGGISLASAIAVRPAVAWSRPAIDLSSVSVAALGAGIAAAAFAYRLLRAEADAWRRSGCWRPSRMAISLDDRRAGLRAAVGRRVSRRSSSGW